MPVLLATRALQQLVAALARHGTLRLADAADAIGVVDLNIEDGLLESGALLFSPPGRERFVALNHQLPGFTYLCECISLLEPATDWAPRFAAQHFVAPSFDLKNWERALFGHEVRILVLLVLEALGGKASAAQIDAVLGLPKGRARMILRRFENRGLVVAFESEGLTIWAFVNAKWMFALRALLGQLLSGRPNLLECAQRVQAAPTGRIPTGRIGRARYKNVPIRTMEKPLGMGVPASRAPLLFSTDARRRILEVIAHKGEATASEIKIMAQAKGDEALRSLVELGIIAKKSAGRVAVYSIAHDLPGREHLGAVLQATARVYSPALAGLETPAMAPARGNWTGNIEKIFGYESRGVALIGARVTGGVDASTLRKLNPEVERVQCRRALHLFNALKVLRTRREGNAILYELDPEWSGYSPLCNFIDALVAASPRHQAWSKVVPLIQLPRRRKMAENARRAGVGA